MANIQSLADLKAYCLRELGAPVINIELEDTQMEDRIDDALQFFVERHYDGVEETYLKQAITLDDVKNGYITIPDEIVAITEILTGKESSSVEVFDDVEYRLMNDFYNAGGMKMASHDLISYYLMKSHLNLMSDMLGGNLKAYEFNRATNKLFIRDGFSSVGSAELLESVFPMGATAEDQANWDTINATPKWSAVRMPNGDTDASEFLSLGVGEFGIGQTIETEGYVRGTYTGRVSLQTNTYSGDIELRIKDRNDNVIASKTIPAADIPTDYWKDFHVTATFAAGHVNDLTLEVVGTAGSVNESISVAWMSLYRNAFVVVRSYKAVDPTTDFDVYDDPWFKSYCTALFKKQWGTNLKKYDQVQLPSGVTIKGQEIYDEAVNEINTLLTEFAQRYEEPDLFLIG